MAITEIAILKLKPTALTADNKPNETIRSFLHRAKMAMESFTGYSFFVYIQLDDPSNVYIFGSWESLAQHYDDWLPSDANQDLLRRGGGLFEIAGLAHLDIDQQEHGISFDAPVVVLEWFYILFERKEAFITCWEDYSRGLEEYTSPWTVRGGWRIDGEREIDYRSAVVGGSNVKAESNVQEFVTFMGWRDDKTYDDSFPHTQGFRQNRQLVEHLINVESKRLVLLDLHC